MFKKRITFTPRRGVRDRDIMSAEVCELTPRQLVLRRQRNNEFLSQTLQLNKELIGIALGVDNPTDFTGIEPLNLSEATKQRIADACLKLGQGIQRVGETAAVVAQTIASNAERISEHLANHTTHAVHTMHAPSFSGGRIVEVSLVAVPKLAAPSCKTCPHAKPLHASVYCGLDEEVRNLPGSIGHMVIPPLVQAVAPAWCPLKAAE